MWQLYSGIISSKATSDCGRGPCQYGPRWLPGWDEELRLAPLRRRQELAPDSAGHSRSVVMAVLADGQKFALSSISKSQTNKSVLYVKLTDSALRSLEEYLKNKVSYF